MKRLYYLIIVTLVFLICMGFNSSRALVWEDEEQFAYRSDNLLRLHIVANSSSPQDQYIKRQVRDLIILETSKLFTGVKSAETAIQVASTYLPTLQQKIQEYLKSLGRDIPVQLELGRFDFPTRTYRDVTLPAGEYQALKVHLGDCEGNNWWCVLFPPLCIDNEEETIECDPTQFINLAFAKEQPGFEIEYRFKFLKAVDDIPHWVKTNYLNILRIALLGSNSTAYLEK